VTHEPNTPRTHNAKGQKVDEPRQCIVCLQVWPCEVARLTEENERLRDLLHGRPHPPDTSGEWAPFGTHVACAVRLDFAGVGEDGLPVWERVVVPAPHIYGEETL
jgi:hypothetical protein